MDNLEKLHKGYDEVPVLYCKNCLSLNIRDVAGINDSDYCDKCGSTDIGETFIDDWELMYKERYGHYYLENY